MARTGPPRVPEKAVQLHIVRFLRSLRATVYVLGTHRRGGDFQGTMQTPGVPDLIAFVPLVDGSLFQVYIECKAAGGRLRPEQQVFRDLCEKAGVDHIVGDLDTVIAWAIRNGLARAQQFPHYRQPPPPDAERELSGDAASAALQQFMSTRFPRRET